MSAALPPVAATPRDAGVVVPPARPAPARVAAARVARARRTIARAGAAMLAPALCTAAALQAHAWRDYRLSDSVAYLDLSDAVAAGAAVPPVNGYWSPLYPWLIGVARRLLAPLALLDVRVAHVVNAALFVVATVALARLLAHAGRAVPTLRRGAPGWWVAHAAFAWATLTTGVVAQMTPDLLVVALTLATVATALPLVTGAAGGRRATRVRAAATGACVGVGYLAKAALLPIGVATLLVVATAMRPWRRGVVAGALMLATAACVALPQLVAVSRHVGHPTFGETGRLNYGWFVGEQALSPVHTAPALRFDPTVLDTDRGRPGTYPPWYDVTRWRHDVRTTFSPARQAGHAGQQGMRLARIAWPLLLVAAIGLLLGGLPAGLGVDATHRRVAVVMGAAACAASGMYVLVLVHPRYVTAPLVLAGGVIAMLVTPTGRVPAWRAACAAALVAAFVAFAAGDRGRDLALAAAVVLGVAAGARRQPVHVILAVACVAAACDRTQPRALLVVPCLVLVAASIPGWLRERTLDGAQVARAAALLAVVLLGADVVRRLDKDDRFGRPTSIVPDAAARAAALRAAGVTPGMRIAAFGKAWEMYWARDVRARIVAEVPDSVVPRWHRDPAVRARVDSTLARHGVRLLVAEDDPRATGPGWRAVDHGLAVHVVPPLAAPSR